MFPLSQCHLGNGEGAGKITTLALQESHWCLPLQNSGRLTSEWAQRHSWLGTPARGYSQMSIFTDTQKCSNIFILVSNPLFFQNEAEVNSEENAFVK